MKQRVLPVSRSIGRSRVVGRALSLEGLRARLAAARPLVEDAVLSSYAAVPGARSDALIPSGQN